MINSMPSLTPTSATERSPLAEQLGRRIDSDRDGQVTSAEFSNFLAGLMQSLDDEQVSVAPSATTPPVANVPVLSVQEPPMSRAQAATLLRQAFEPVVRNR